MVPIACWKAISLSRQSAHVMIAYAPRKRHHHHQDFRQLITELCRVCKTARYLCNGMVSYTQTEFYSAAAACFVYVEKEVRSHNLSLRSAYSSTLADPLRSAERIRRLVHVVHTIECERSNHITSRRYGLAKEIAFQSSQCSVSIASRLPDSTCRRNRIA